MWEDLEEEKGREDDTSIISKYKWNNFLKLNKF